MKTLTVFDKGLAQQMISAGIKPIKSQFDIEQTEMWLFALCDTMSLCFDIDSAVRSGKCSVVDRFKMTF